MAIKITETNVEFMDSSFADGGQSTTFHEDKVITKAMSWPDEWERGQSFTKQDFEQALKKVSRKIKIGRARQVVQLSRGEEFRLVVTKTFPVATIGITDDGRRFVLCPLPEGMKLEKLRV